MESSEIEAFSAWWAERFGEVLPLGYKLRSAFPDRWFRIHSLPESKRYANDDREYDILIERQRVLADEVLGPRAPCLLVTPHYHELGLGTKHELLEFFDWLSARPDGL